MTHVEMLDRLLWLAIKEQTLDDNSDEFDRLYDYLMQVMLDCDNE